jgi:hypothetical protein
VLRISGPKREEVRGGWRRLHNEELHNVYASLNIVRVIKSKRMRWTGHVACIGDMRNAYKIWSENLVGCDLMEDLSIDGRQILEWILRKFCGKLWVEFIQFRMETSDRFL